MSEFCFYGFSGSMLSICKRFALKFKRFLICSLLSGCISVEKWWFVPVTIIAFCVDFYVLERKIC